MTNTRVNGATERAQGLEDSVVKESIPSLAYRLRVILIKIPTGVFIQNWKAKTYLDMQRT